MIEMILMVQRHFVNLPFCQLDILSTWHFINLTFCQLNILSTCHFVSLPFCQLKKTSFAWPNLKGNFIMKQVASNKSSLLLTMNLENRQTLKIFTMIIKTESIYKSN